MLKTYLYGVCREIKTFLVWGLLAHLLCGGVLGAILGSITASMHGFCMVTGFICGGIMGGALAVIFLIPTYYILRERRPQYRLICLTAGTTLGWLLFVWWTIPILEGIIGYCLGVVACRLRPEIESD